MALDAEEVRLRSRARTRRNYWRDREHKLAVQRGDGLAPAELEAHRKTRNEYMKQWRVTNRTRISLLRRAKQYGISATDIVAMFEAQNGRCAICKTSVELIGSAHVDHCHATSTVRGLLCQRCNLLIGHAKDSTDILERAIAYLRGPA